MAGYTSVIRNNFLSLTPGSIFCANDIYRKNFSSIPEATFYKILERLVNESAVSRLAAGLYCVPKITPLGKVNATEKEIIEYFTQNNKGIVVGYRLYNEIGLTTQVSGTVRIYSGNITEKTKTVKNIRVTKIPLSFTPKESTLLKTMDILDNFSSIEDLDIDTFKKYMQSAVKMYDDAAMSAVMNAVKYKKRTIAFFKDILDSYSIPNNLAAYLSSLSKYKIPDWR